MDAVVHMLRPNFTGADLYALCSDAMLCAIKRVIASLERKASSTNAAITLSAPPSTIKSTSASAQSSLPEFRTADDTPLVVTNDDFAEALANITPSVSMEELARYDQLAREFSPNK